MKSWNKSDGEKEAKEYKLWSKLPYEHEKKPIAMEGLGGEWPLYFLCKSSNGKFYKLHGESIRFKFKNPNSIDYESELKNFKEIQKFLKENSPEEFFKIVDFWNTEVASKQWILVSLELIKTYKVKPISASRILSNLQLVASDALSIAWYYKMLFNCPRPSQLINLTETIISTPEIPSYPSSHAVVAGACTEVLVRYFPTEEEKIRMLCNDAGLSRVYGGVNFKSDVEEGVRLGIQIAYVALSEIRKEKDSIGNPISIIYEEFKDCPIFPYY